MAAIFTTATFDFLFDLDVHNSTSWMDENRDRYEQHAKQPMYAFVEAVAEPLRRAVSPHIEAIPKIQGGSVFQLHRDTRFSEDKTPYKRNIGAWFKHDHASKQLQAPGLYLHLEPGNCFTGAGIYRPPTKVLTPIRERIVANRGAWTRAKNALEADGWELIGDQLKTAPRGFDKDDPAIEDLRRTSFTVGRDFDEKDALREDFVDRWVSWMAETRPLLRYLCTALDIPF